MRERTFSSAGLKEIVGGRTYVREPAEIIPVQIRPDLVVRIHGIPWDMTQAEAAKLAAVITALATADTSGRRS